MIQLTDPQRTTTDAAKAILRQYGVVYIAGEVRTGKTPISIITAIESGWKNICFVTKIKAMSGVKKFTDMTTGVRWNIVNIEQVHKLMDEYDGYIVDEAHGLGAFPIPSKRAVILKQLINNKPLILLSGTPNPEAMSQLFHQFFISTQGPWNKYPNFYKWAHDYVQKRPIEENGVTKYAFYTKRVNGYDVNDYSKAKQEEIQADVRPYMVNLSQEQAGFTSFVEEQIITIPIDDKMYRLMDVLKKDKVYKMKCGDYIIADTPVRLQNLFHQISSGTVIATNLDQTERNYHILDESKAWYIKSRFAGQKIAIYYKFVSEGNLLKRVFENWTDDSMVFNDSTDKTFICQVVSGREGVNLSTADALVMYNIDFSATSYWQVRARMQELGRTIASKLYWIFSEKGIERLVYKAVVKKKAYTSRYFMKEINLIGR